MAFQDKCIDLPYLWENQRILPWHHEPLVALNEAQAYFLPDFVQRTHTTRSFFMLPIKRSHSLNRLGSYVVGLLKSLIG